MSLIRSLDKLPVPPSDHLVGRAALLDDINNRLAPGQAVFLYGVPGVGKRTLAAAVAAQRIESQQHVLWLTTYRDNLQTLVNQVLRAYNTDNPDLVAGLLEHHTPLIVINGIDSHEIAAQFVWQYRSASVMVLHETAVDGPWEPILVRRLDEDASRQLFTKIAGAAPPAPLLDYLSGHPLSIRLVALQIEQKIITAEDFLKQLPPPILDPVQRAVYVIQTIFNLLPQAQQGLLLAMCANFSNGLSVGLLNRMLGTASLGLCEPLVEHGFLTQHHARGVLYYDIHPLIKSFAIQQLAANYTLDAARNRMLNATTAFSKTYATPQQQHILTSEIDNILNAALYSLQTHQYTAAAQIVGALSSMADLTDDYQVELAHIHKLMKTAQVSQTTQIAPSEDTGIIDATAEVTVSSEVSLTPPDETLPTRPKEWDALDGEVMAEDGEETPKALATPLQSLQLAFDDAAARHDRPEMARVAMQLGQLYLDLQDTESALEQWNTAVRLYQEIGDLTNVLHVLELLSIHSHRYQGADRALQYVRRGLNIAQQLGDDEIRCRFMTTMGDIYSAMGDTDGAIEVYKRAVKIWRGLDEAENTGVTLGKLATVYMDCRRYREATVALSQAISLFEEVGNRELQGRSLGNLGTALGHLGRWHEAGQRHAAALRIARERGDVEEERFQLQNLAYVAESDKQLKWAIHYGRQALYLAMLTNDPVAIGELTYDLARLLVNDPAMLGQVVILLEKSAEYNPQAQALLREAKIRLLKREQSGRPILPVEPDLLAYAGESYPHQHE